MGNSAFVVCTVQQPSFLKGSQICSDTGFHNMGNLKGCIALLGM